MAPDADVLLPARIVGPSLTAAGLAAFMLSQAGRDQEAAQCGEIQELIDTALRGFDSVPKAYGSSWARAVTGRIVRFGDQS